MPSLKVLSLPSWANTDTTVRANCFMKSNYRPVDYLPIVVDRIGLYLYGDKCWFVNSLGCWQWDKASFLYALSTHSLPSLSNHEQAALSAICQTKYATKRQHKLYNQLLLEIADLKCRQHEYRFRKLFGL